MLFNSTFYKAVIVLAVVVYGITAWNSHGYYQADEHYQIIEFAGKKLGTHRDKDLAWEWNTQSRQTIQPFMVFLVFSALNAIGIEDPYSQAFILRLLSMLLSLFVVHFFLRSSLHIVSSGFQRAYVVCSYFLWFMPYIYVRFSSETWSAAMLLLVFSIILSGNIIRKYAAFAIGLLLGFAFLFRYQSAFLSLGLILWLVFVYKENFRRLSILFSGIISVLFIGFIIDSWFYEEWLFVPWNYFFHQLLEGKSTEFGAYPWYFYLQNMFLAPSWPIGILFFFSFLHLIIRRPKNLIVWSLIPFIIAHNLVPHKEIRFFFVFINLMPLIFFSSLQLLPSINSLKYLKKMAMAILVFTASLNVVALLALSMKSAGLGRQAVTKYIHEEFEGQKVNLICTSWSSPYAPWGLTKKFYVEPNVKSQKIFSLCELDSSLLEEEMVNLLVLRKADEYDRNCIEKVSPFQKTLHIESVPKWIQKLNDFYGQMNSNELLLLYELELKTNPS